MRRVQFRNSTSPPAHMWPQDSSSPREPIHSSVTPLRLVLLGRTGSGKSATGNTILKKESFLSKLSMSSVTEQCQKECGEVEGRRLELIDTPGFFDTSLKVQEITEEVIKCMVMCSPGPHAFLLIIPIARFTEEQQKTVERIEETFKENINNHTIIIFTRADELEGKAIEEFVSEQDQRIKDLIARFSGRFLPFNNKNPENRDQVKRLLEKLDELLEQNQFRHFTSQNTEVIQKALALLEQKSQEKLEEAIKTAKQDVRKMAEGRKADIMKSLEEDKQEIIRRRKDIQAKINQFTVEIRKENENHNQDSLRLRCLHRSLEIENNMLKCLGIEKQVRRQRREQELHELEIWIKEEEERREQEERKKAEHDKSKWYNNKTYFTILMFVIVFLGGAGFGWLIPLLTSTAAPVGMAAKLTALLGPELAALVMSAVTNSGPAMSAATTLAPLVARLCSIQ